VLKLDGPGTVITPRPLSGRVGEAHFGGNT
jgi:hypothetical protein